jgi:hypothetical protein
MTLETWSTMLAAAAFLLVGIAASPLAWVALQHRRSRFEQHMERRWRETTLRLGALEERLEQFDATIKDQPDTEEHGEDRMVPQGPHWPRTVYARSKRGEAARAVAAPAPTLIAVPSLAAPPSEREASIEGISHRYAAIWSLADSGAPADVIARATGQPIGQIELILGLRRQIDASHTKVPHVPQT